jgi:hypothetical protein
MRQTLNRPPLPGYLPKSEVLSILRLLRNFPNLRLLHYQHCAKLAYLQAGRFQLGQEHSGRKMRFLTSSLPCICMHQFGNRSHNLRSSDSDVVWPANEPEEKDQFNCYLQSGFPVSVVAIYGLNKLLTCPIVFASSPQFEFIPLRSSTT